MGRRGCIREPRILGSLLERPHGEPLGRLSCPVPKGFLRRFLKPGFCLTGDSPLKPKRSRKTRATVNRRVPASQGKALRTHEKPWRVVSRTIHQFPRCFAYLKAMRVPIGDPEMTDYWAAVSMADAFSDDRLAKLGTISFDTMTGRQLLKAFEKILAQKPKQQRRNLKPVSAVDEIRGAASEAEIIAAMTPKGGWKASTLAGWGIAWPPPQGWRRKLVENFEAKAG